MHRQKQDSLYINLMVSVGLISMLSGFSLYYIKYLNTFIHICPIVMMLLLVLNRNYLFKNENFKYAILYCGAWFFIYGFSAIGNQHQVDFSRYVFVLWGGIFIALKDKIRFEIFDKFVRILAFILCLSIVEFVITSLIGKFSNLGTVVREVNQEPFANLVLNLVSLRGNIARFQSLAEEPGVIGTITAFLIFVLDEKKYKKERIIFGISGILSFSMTFYVISIFYLIVIKHNIKMIVLSFFVLLVFFCFFRVQFDKFIVYRVIENRIDNRTHAKFNFLFERAYQNGELWLGKGYAAHSEKASGDGGNAGAKVFIYAFGIWGLLTMFVVYNYILLNMAGNRKEFCFFIAVFWLSFYQRDNIYFAPNIIVFFSFYLQKKYINLSEE